VKAWLFGSLYLLAIILLSYAKGLQENEANGGGSRIKKDRGTDSM
jgi:hypothetical protein